METTPSMRVLIVEDEEPIARGLERGLERAGFQPEVSRDGEAGWALGDVEPFAAAILDLGLPRLDGLSVLRRWRSDGIAMPVMVVSARDSWTQRVEALNAGADDYLVKPFVMDELVARLHAILRRGAGRAANALEDGDLLVDLAARRASLAGQPLDLTALEFRLLHTLVHRAGETVSQAELGEALYGDRLDRRDNAIEAAIMRLRRKVGRERIATRRGFGYAWRPIQPGDELDGGGS